MYIKYTRCSVPLDLCATRTECPDSRCIQHIFVHRIRTSANVPRLEFRSIRDGCQAKTLGTRTSPSISVSSCTLDFGGARACILLHRPWLHRNLSLRSFLNRTFSDPDAR